MVLRVVSWNLKLMVPRGALQICLGLAHLEVHEKKKEMSELPTFQNQKALRNIGFWLLLKNEIMDSGFS